jgi:hypothetical protein
MLAWTRVCRLTSGAALGEVLDQDDRGLGLGDDLVAVGIGSKEPFSRLPGHSLQAGGAAGDRTRIGTQGA